MYFGVKVPKIDVDSAKRCKQKKTKAGQTASFASIYNQGHCHGGVTENLLNEHFHTSLRRLTSGNSLSLIGTSSLLPNNDSGS